MTIHYLETYLENLWDWGFLDDCFKPSKIKVTDIDGLVERKGHFLLIETKMPNVEIPLGQALLFNALLDTGCFDILIIWGNRNKPEYRQFWGYPTKQTTNTENIRYIVQRWFARSDSHKIKVVFDRAVTVEKDGDKVTFECDAVLTKGTRYRITIREVEVDNS